MTSYPEVDEARKKIEEGYKNLVMRTFQPLIKASTDRAQQALNGFLNLSVHNERISFKIEDGKFYDDRTMKELQLSDLIRIYGQEASRLEESEDIADVMAKLSIAIEEQVDYRIRRQKTVTF